MVSPSPASTPVSTLERVRDWFHHRPLLADATLGLGLVTVLGWLIQAEQGGFRVPDSLAYVCAVALGALLLFRRRVPLLVLLLSMGVLVVYSALGYPYIGLAIPLAPALFSAAAQHRLRWPVTIASSLIFLIFVAALAASYVRETDSNVFALFIHSVAPEAALMAAMIVLGESVRSRRELAERSARVIEATAERERALAQAAAATQGAEIARDIHDTLGHQTTVISMHTDVAAEALPANPQSAQNALEVIGSTSRQMMRQLRQTVHTLRQCEVNRPTVSIARLDQSVFAESALRIDSQINVPNAYSHDVEAAAYRIVQEALTNVSKHSASDEATVRIRPLGDHLEIIVEDHGPRRNTRSSAGTGVGILGMKERASALGGTVEAAPNNAGFVVRALLPALLVGESHPVQEGSR